MRYAQPRKLKTIRGERKAALNAWCVRCRQPMARHGKNFTCSRCHLATRIVMSGRIRSTTTARKQNSQASLACNSGYPFCVTCRVMMHRVSRTSVRRSHAFRCRLCKAITASQIDNSKRLAREAAILGMLRAGYLDVHIVRKMKCHHKTVKKLRLLVTDVRRCECGQLFHHVNRCELRPGWQTFVRERRSAFEDLLQRINRRVPAALPDEMRDDICQEILLDVMRSIDKILANVPAYISEYKKRYPFQYHSFDANPKLMERIAG